MATSEEIGLVGSTNINTGIEYKRHAKDASTLKSEQDNIHDYDLMATDPNDPKKALHVFGMIYFVYWRLNEDADREELATTDLIQIAPNDIESGNVTESDIVAISIERYNKTLGKRETIHFFSDRMDIYSQGTQHVEGYGTNNPIVVESPTETSVECHYAQWATINPSISPQTHRWVKHETIDNSIYKVPSMSMIYLTLRDNMLASGNEGERAKYSQEISG